MIKYITAAAAAMMLLFAFYAVTASPCDVDEDDMEWYRKDGQSPFDVWAIIRLPVSRANEVEYDFA